jgi:hypothetical protein
MTDERYPDRGFRDKGPEEEVNHDMVGVEWDDVTFVNPPFLRQLAEFKRH